MRTAALASCAMLGLLVVAPRAVAVQRRVGGESKRVVGRDLPVLRVHYCARDVLASYQPGEVPLRVVKAPKREADAVANAVGIIIGVGASFLFVPILASIFADRNALEGLSLQAWMCNVATAVLSIAYPQKRGFPVSTYVESIVGGAQGWVILGLLCRFHGLGVSFVLGSLATACILGAFIAYPKVPAVVTSGIQLTAMAISMYANIPQIVLSYRTQKTSWSAITASLSLVGCAMRMFTTVRLTKDSLQLISYFVAFATNLVLLVQVIAYGRASA